MPRGDGTGPFGMGPGTGRRRGGCAPRIGFSPGGRIPSPVRNRWLLGLAVPVIVAAIRDISNPRGLLRQCASVFFPKKPLQRGTRISCDAEFSVLDSKLSKKQDEKRDERGTTEEN